MLISDKRAINDLALVNAPTNTHRLLASTLHLYALLGRASNWFVLINTLPILVQNIMLKFCAVGSARWMLLLSPRNQIMFRSIDEYAFTVNLQVLWKWILSWHLMGPSFYSTNLLCLLIIVRNLVLKLHLSILVFETECNRYYCRVIHEFIYLKLNFK